MKEQATFILGIEGVFKAHHKIVCRYKVDAETCPANNLLDNVPCLHHFLCIQDNYNVPEISIRFQVDSQWEIVEFWNN
jgi:hypothetical protein